MQFIKIHKKLVGLMTIVCIAFVAIIATIATMLFINPEPEKQNIKNELYSSSYVDELVKASQTGSGDKIFLFDFEKYKGDNMDPGGFFCATVEMGETYTLSLEYCVVGESLGVTFVNAANEWGMGSEVSFGHEPLQGKNKVSITFTADYPYVYPTFQVNVPKGCAKVYVWNMSLEKEGTGKNIIKNVGVGTFEGAMADQGLISVVDIDTDKLKGSVVEMAKDPVCLFDFEKYNGENECPGAGLSLDVEMGKDYTFSFDYCVMGESTSTTCINATNEWGMGSNVEFNSTPLVGKGSYSVSFKADYPQVYPVFQSFTPNGKPQLYVWNIKLIKKGTNKNLSEKIALKSFQGALLESKGAVSFAKVNTAKLEPTVHTTIDSDGIINVPNNLASNVWLIDFEKYKGKDETPGMFISSNVEQGATYTFSFNYCVIGSATGITCINAANEWKLGSKVKFDSNPLIGKGNYSVSFKADTSEVLPVIQSHIPLGRAKVYVWNMQLVKNGKPGNLLKSVGYNNLQGKMKENDCISSVKVNTDELEPTVKFKANIANNTWLLDFSKYKGKEDTPGMFFPIDVEKGQTYKFSFKYCVVGDSSGTTCVNAASEWKLGSKVKFDSKALQGKGKYSVKFKADYEQILPVIQSHLPNGKPKVYVWDLKLEKIGSGKNILADISYAKFQGKLVDKNLVSLSKVNTNKLKPTVSKLYNIAENTWVIDFSKYKGKNETPGMFYSADVKKGKKYELSFNYCVIGDTTATTVVNAANEWGMGSKVKFDSTPLQGKGVYKVSFKADYPQILPVVQSHLPNGKPKVYIWNLKLKKAGSKKNMLKDIMNSAFQGDMIKKKLVKRTKVNTKKLKPTVKEVNYVANTTWLIDFSKYKGSNETPGMLFSTDVKKGKKYKFSFNYCVIGDSMQTTVVNAANEWGLGSKVKFENNFLSGKGTYSTTFTADYPELLPVFQSCIASGAPKLYIWNIKLQEDKSNVNLLKNTPSSVFQGDMVKEGLVSKSKVNTSSLKPTETNEETVWLIDFTKYNGSENDIGTFFEVSVEKDSEYTFSFDYCVKGESTGTTVINAACDWGIGSKVSFNNNKLTGKGSYTTTFKADWQSIIPVFQTHVPYGKPQLYIWNMKLVKTGTTMNMLKGFKLDKFTGVMKEEGLVTALNISADEL